VLLVVSVVVFLTAIFLLVQSKTVPADSDLADLLKKNPNEYALALGHVFDLTPRALGLFRGPLAMFSIALLVGTLLNLLYRRRNFAQAGNWVLTVMMVFVLFAVHQGLVRFSPILSSKKLADAIEQPRHKTRDLLCRPQNEAHGPRPGEKSGGGPDHGLTLVSHGRHGLIARSAQSGGLFL
jgi:hypothetical protein